MASRGRPPILRERILRAVADTAVSTDDLDVMKPFLSLWDVEGSREGLRGAGQYLAEQGQIVVFRGYIPVVFAPSRKLHIIIAQPGATFYGFPVEDVAKFLGIKRKAGESYVDVAWRHVFYWLNILDMREDTWTRQKEMKIARRVAKKQSHWCGKMMDKLLAELGFQNIYDEIGNEDLADRLVWRYVATKRLADALGDE